MKGFFGYLSAGIKRSIRFYPAIFALTLAIMLSVGLLLFGMLEQNVNDEGNIRLQVGLLGDIEDTHLGIGITALQELDSSRFYVEFLPMEKEKAQNALDSGDIIGYITVPEGFVDSVINGENKKLVYTSGGSPDALGPVLTKEVLALVSDLVTESQNGVFGLDLLGEKYSMSHSEIYDSLMDMNIIYFDYMFSRGDACQLNIIGTGLGLDFGDYYTAAMLLLLLMLWGTVCVLLMVKRNNTLSAMLYIKGRCALCQTLADYISFALIIAINTALLFVSADIFGIELYFDFFSVLPCVLLICAMQFLIYELCRSVMTGVMLQMLCTLVLSYISGFFYPKGALPEIVSRSAELTPTGVAFSYMGKLFYSRPAPSLWIQPMLYTAVLLLAAALVRRLRIGGQDK